MTLKSRIDEQFVYSTWFSILAISAAFALDSIGGLFVLLSHRNYEFHSTGPGLWTLQMSDIEPGEYFISGGRVKGACTLKAPGVTLSTGAANSQKVQSVLLGTEVNISQKQSGEINISCPPQGGFTNGLADKAVMLDFSWGIALHIFRAFLYLILGPLMSLLLLAQCVTFSATHKDTSSTRPDLAKTLILFSVVSLTYSISLGRLPNFFLPNYDATLFHIVLRSLLSISVIRIARVFEQIPKWIEFSYLGLIIGDISVGLIFSHNPTSLVSIYKFQYPWYGITTYLVYRKLLRSQIHTRSVNWLKAILFAWTIAQSADAILNWLDAGSFKSPIVIFLVTIAMMHIRKAEISLTARIEGTVERILDVLGSKLPIDQILRTVAHLAIIQTRFRRLSIYIDAFCIGRADVPRQLFCRIESYNYKKDTVNDVEIDFRDHRGQVMKEAMNQHRMISRFGPIGDWYCVVPIGQLACINFSDDQPTHPSVAFENHEILIRLTAVINSIEDKLAIQSLRLHHLIERIKLIRGYGEWPSKLGAIFADIEDFSKMTSKYKILASGKDVFGRFVASTYFPALAKVLLGYAELEMTEGDQAYFVVIPDLISRETSVEKAVSKAVELLAIFIENDGALLCQSEGLPPIKMRVGVSLGDGVIICDETQFRTVGDTVITAARLVNVAPSGSIMIPESLTPLFSNEDFYIGEAREILEKKDLIRAVPIKTIAKNAFNISTPSY